MTKFSRWFEIGLFLFVIAIYGYAAASDAINFPGSWFTRDDAYYYFKVAQNITEGRGATFDGVNPTNGYHPLWMLVCIPVFALARFDLILPLRILLIIIGALHAATAVLLYRLIERIFSRPLGILAAMAWATSRYILTHFNMMGLETTLTAFAMVLFLYWMQEFERTWRGQAVRPGQIAALAGAGLLVLFSRLDSVFLVLLFGLWIVFRGTSMRTLLLLDILATTAAVLGGFVFRIGVPAYYPYVNLGLGMIVLSLALQTPIYFFMGLYQPAGSRTTAGLIRRTALGAAVSAAAVAAIVLGARQAGLIEALPLTSVVAVYPLLAVFLSIVVRLTARAFSSRKADINEMAPLALLKSRWRTWVTESAIYYGIVGGALALYMGVNKLLFGAFTPVSGQIKQWWGTFDNAYGGAPKFQLAFWGVSPDNDFNAWRPFTTQVERWTGPLFYQTNLFYVGYDNTYLFLIALLVLAFLAMLYLHRRRSVRALAHLGAVPLFAGSMAQVLNYTALGYAGVKEWYWVSQYLVQFVAAFIAADFFLHPLLRRLRRPRVGVGIALLICLLMANNFTRNMADLMPHTNRVDDRAYLDAAVFLEEYTGPGAMIGMTGGGNVGYFIHDRTIVNMDGLINSYAYFQALQAGQAAEYLEQMGLDYVFANPEILDTNYPYRGQFEGRLGRGIRYGGKFLMPFFTTP
ncbi:MAG: hypothetical protein AB1564_13205 [Chloroflexota bacterium]